MNRNSKFVYIYVPRLDFHTVELPMDYGKYDFATLEISYCGDFKDFSSGHRKQINAGKRKRKREMTTKTDFRQHQVSTSLVLKCIKFVHLPRNRGAP